MSTPEAPGEAVRAVAWRRAGDWLAAGYRVDGTLLGELVALGLPDGAGIEAMRTAAERFGVPVESVVLVASSYAPDRAHRPLRPGFTAAEELDRAETLAEIVQEWADGGGTLQDALDRMTSALERLSAPPMTDAERAAVVAQIEGGRARPGAAGPGPAGAAGPRGAAAGRARHRDAGRMSEPRTLCSFCQRYVLSVIARWNRWFCDEDCARAWERERDRKR